MHCSLDNGGQGLTDIGDHLNFDDNSSMFCSEFENMKTMAGYDLLDKSAASLFDLDPRRHATMERFVIDSEDDPFIPSMTQDYYKRKGNGTQANSIGSGHRVSEASCPWTSLYSRQRSPDETITSLTSSRARSVAESADICAGYDGQCFSANTTCSAVSEQCLDFDGYLPEQEYDYKQWPKPQSVSLQQIQSHASLESDLLLSTGEQFSYSLEPNHFMQGEMLHHHQPLDHGGLHNADAEGEPDDTFETLKHPKSDESEFDHKSSQTQMPQRRPKLPRNKSRPGRSLTAFKITKLTEQTSLSLVPQGSDERPGTVNDSLAPHKIITAASSSASRPFSCPLIPYGCHTTFASKNEWKRHITTQHICLGFWRCDLCPDVMTRPNDFKRKDLFTQHVRRMHSTAAGSLRGKVDSRARHDHSKTGSEPAGSELEKELENIRARCWIKVRSLPTKLSCAACGKYFTGDGSFEQWLEHVGRHVASAATRHHQTSKSRKDRKASEGNPIDWGKDEFLRTWLFCERLIEWDATSGLWSLVEQSVSLPASAHNKQIQGRHSEQDAEVQGD